MPFTRTNWMNYSPPAINAANLLNMEDGIWYGLAHSGGIRNVAEFAEKNPGSSTGGIQEAIDDLPSGGGKVFIPAGTHTCSVGITISDHVSLVGAGKGTTILSYTGAGVAITADGAPGGTAWRGKISDLKLTTSAGTHGIRIKDLADFELNNVWVRGFSAAGVHLNATAGLYVISARILNSTIEENTGDGILADGINSAINHIIIKNSAVRNNANNINCDVIAYDWLIEGNNLEAQATTKNAIRFNGPIGLSIRANYFESNVTNAPWIYLGVAAPGSGISINGSNVFVNQDPGNGTAIQLGTGAGANFIEGAVIKGNNLGNFSIAVYPLNTKALEVGPNAHASTTYVFTGAITSDGIKITDDSGVYLTGGAGAAYQSLFMGLGAVKTPALKYEEFTIDSAADVDGPLGTGLFFVVRDNDGGWSAIVFYDNGQVPNIIAQGGVVYVNGAPGVNEIQIKNRAGSLGVAFRAGANKDGNVLRTTMILADYD